MYNPVRKILVFLVLIFVVPSIIFLILELDTLSGGEETIGAIYDNQLNAILFSVNQYTNDVVSDWVNVLDYELIRQSGNPDAISADGIRRFFGNNYSVQHLFIAGEDSIYQHSAGTFAIGKKTIDSVILAKQHEIRKLFSFRRGGFTQPLPIPGIPSREFTLFIAALEPRNGKEFTCGFITDTRTFASQYLKPRIDEIAQDKFIIAVFDSAAGTIAVTTDAVPITGLRQSKPLWLLPQFSVGIELKGETVEELVNSRTNRSLILTVILILVLLAGVIVVFINIRKELLLAKIRSEFVANVSHELRTPLALISMYAETLEMGRFKTEAKAKEYYSIISSESRRLSNIVNRILNFSKTESGKRTYHFDSVDASALIHSVCETYRHHLESNGFQFQCVSPPEEVTISADRDALTECIINLIDNAQKYSDKTKEIAVTLTADSNKAIIEVADKGIGIPGEYQKRIFEKFFRVPSGSVHNTKGAGLGLALVFSIIKAHSGTIALKSEPGSGSTFTITLPLLSNQRKKEMHQ